MASIVPDVHSVSWFPENEFGCHLTRVGFPGIYIVWRGREKNLDGSLPPV